MGNQEQPSNKEPKRYNSIIKYSGLAIQMGLTIYLGNLVGKYLDNHFETTNQVWTKVLTLLVVFGSMFTIIRQVIKDSADD